MKRMATPIAAGHGTLSARTLEKLRRVHRRRDKKISNWIRRNRPHEAQ